MIIFEKIEDFWAAVDKIVDKETPVFLTKNKNMTQQLILNGSLVFQVKFGGDIIQYTYTEHIEPIQLMPQVALDQLAQIVSAEDIERINVAIKNKMDTFNAQLETEFNKGKEVYIAKGFKNVIEATAVS